MSRAEDLVYSRVFNPYTVKWGLQEHLALPNQLELCILNLYQQCAVWNFQLLQFLSGSGDHK